MSLPVYAKTWNFSSLNVRSVYSSLAQVMGDFMYNIKNEAVGVGGAVVWSCDGTTGPSSSSDHTDRIASGANFRTRATVAAAAQSWVLFTFAGGQVLLDYQGATDDIARISFSPGSLFALAGTTTNQPTATDECVMVSGASLIKSTTSGDRVFSIIATTDQSCLRWVIATAGAYVHAGWIENVSPAPGVSSSVIIGETTSNTYSNLYATGSAAGGSSAANAIGSGITRVNSTNVQVHGGSIVFDSNLTPTPFVAASPVLNSGSPVFPIVVASVTSGNDGWIGTRFDVYAPMTTGAAFGDTYDDITQGTRMALIGGAGLWPWDPTKGVTVS